MYIMLLARTEIEKPLILPELEGEVSRNRNPSIAVNIEKMSGTGTRWFCINIIRQRINASKIAAGEKDSAQLPATKAKITCR